MKALNRYITIVLLFFAYIAEAQPAMSPAEMQALDAPAYTLAERHPILLVDYLSAMSHTAMIAPFTAPVAIATSQDDSQQESIMFVNLRKDRYVDLSPFRCGPYSVADPLPLFYPLESESYTLGEALFFGVVEGILDIAVGNDDSGTDIFGMFKKKKPHVKHKW